MTTVTSVAAAYDATGAAWQAGPGRVYDHLAEVLTDRCPVPLGGALVLDVGAGTGAATRAARRRGGRVVAVDLAHGMLATGAAGRSPPVVGDAATLPVAGGTFDAALAMFSLNHVARPAQALRELARVLRPGGGFLVTAYAAEDHHPVRDAVDAAATARGWTVPAWYEALRRDVIPLLATVEAAEEATAAAGLDGARVEVVAVDVPGLDAEDLVAWRLGMAQLAPFVAALAPADRAALVADALARIGEDAPPLVRNALVISFVLP